MPNHLARRPPWKRMHEGGHYSSVNNVQGGQYPLVNNVQGNISHSDNGRKVPNVYVRLSICCYHVLLWKIMPQSYFGVQNKITATFSSSIATQHKRVAVTNSWLESTSRLLCGLHVSDISGYWMVSAKVLCRNRSRVNRYQALPLQFIFHWGEERAWERG